MCFVHCISLGLYRYGEGSRLKSYFNHPKSYLRLQVGVGGVHADMREYRCMRCGELSCTCLVWAISIAATTHTGSSCACCGGPSPFWSRFDKQSPPIKSSSGQLPRANHTTLSRCRHCDGEVVIHSINGYLVLITHLLRALLRALYTTHYIDDAKGWLYL